VSGKSQVDIAFHRSVTLCVFLSSLVLASAEGVWFPVGLTPLIAIGTFLIFGRWPRLAAPVAVANILGAIAIIVASIEFYSGTIYGKLLAGAHMLVYLTWIVLLMRKGFRQFWWLCALSLLQLAVAAVITQDAMFGASLIGMLFVLIWTLSVFSLFRAQSYMQVDQGYLPVDRRTLQDTLSGGDAVTATHREAGRGSEKGSEKDRGSVVLVHDGLQSDADERWMGWGFRLVVGWTAVGSLIVAMIAFAVFPRYFVPGVGLEALDRDRQAITARTGFSEEIQLGNQGTIHPSEDRVLQFSIFQNGSEEEGADDEQSSTVTVDAYLAAMNQDELRLRGTALSQYRNGRWTRSVAFEEEQWENASRRFVVNRRDTELFRVRITLDPPIGQYVFSLTPMQNAINLDGPGNIRVANRTGSLAYSPRRSWPGSRPVTYEIHCPRLSTDSSVLGQLMLFMDLINLNTGRGRSAGGSSWRVRSDSITPDIDNSLPQLARLAQQVCESQSEQALTPHERIAAINRFLGDSEDYTYSLNQTVTDRSLDPVEDFLVNHKTGHCEYFASACALMLQAVDVPARVVNGYKGSELNSLTGQYEVRQKHAHAWVEAWVDGHWLTVDPTPAAAREESVQSTGSLGLLTDLKGAFADKWFTFVQKMSLDRQRELARPIVVTFKDMMETIRRQGLWEAFKLFVSEYVMSPRKWFSWQGGAVTFVLLWTIGIIVRRRPWRTVMNWLRRLRRQFDSRHRATRSVIRFYETFLNVCRRQGLNLPATQTANENATHATEFFSHQLTSSELRAIPHRIANAFNQVRFGAATLTPDQAAAVRMDLQRFSSLVSQRRQGVTDVATVAD
jgi:transglutaminase-like putative cysteine protease